MHAGGRLRMRVHTHRGRIKALARCLQHRSPAHHQPCILQHGRQGGRKQAPIQRGSNRLLRAHGEIPRLQSGKKALGHTYTLPYLMYVSADDHAVAVQVRGKTMFVGTVEPQDLLSDRVTRAHFGAVRCVMAACSCLYIANTEVVHLFQNLVQASRGTPLTESVHTC